MRERIKVAWRQKKSFFDTYTSARDAVEHIHGDVTTTNQFMNWSSDDGTVTAAVTPRGSAEVSETALAELRACRDAILTGLQLDHLVTIANEQSLRDARAGFLWTLMDKATTTNHDGATPQS